MPHQPVAVAAALALLAAAVSGADAQEAPKPADPISIELNKLEAAGEDCQATVVATNGAARLDSLKLDLVVFDGEGVVAKRLAAELGPLAAKKTVVKTFPVKGLACSSMSRVVLNDVISCAGPSGPVTDCIDRLELKARAKVEFAK
ncbi:hypothetical protein [Aureimonas leprariae]|uniref:Tat pathway signal sequence domain protein n=1 Tax=Plantimonas leprariae TaxID=2615207 RepID=A0A7V7TYG1_9HYPH|nr:hypothetical protein [Aureimonas leprariae]KAB0677217.1 hypothetical protein F6X38_19035 [Aureimonas leprariae]